MIKIKWKWLCGIFGFDAMYFLLVIFVKDEEAKEDWMLMNHEMIHMLQNIELLFVGQWFLYSLSFVVNLFRFRFDFHQAYMNIPFEKEAYHHEDDEYYLLRRKPYNWINHL